MHELIFLWVNVLQDRHLFGSIIGRNKVDCALKPPGESHTSNHLSYLEGHIQRMEEQLEELCEELQRQKASTDHLGKFCESLQTQIRIMGAEQSAIDSRPCAPLPGE